MTTVLIRRGKRGHRHTQREDDVKIEKEIGVTLLQAKECLGSWKRQRRVLP